MASLTRVWAPTSLTHTVLGSSGAHPNQMKQVKMILKAQEVHFELHNSAHHRNEVDMTNDGHTSSTGAQGTILWVCHLCTPAWHCDQTSGRQSVCQLSSQVGLRSSSRTQGRVKLDGRGVAVSFALEVTEYFTPATLTVQILRPSCVACPTAGARPRPTSW